MNEWMNELIYGDKRNGWRDELSDYIDWAGCFYGKHFCDKLEGYPNASENICPYKPKLLHLANA